MNDFLEKIKGFFKDEQSFLEAKQLIEKNWLCYVPDFFQNLLNTWKNAVFVLDEEDNFVYVNPVAEMLSAKKSQDLVGHSLWTLFPEEWDSDFGHLYRQCRREQKKDHLERFFPNMNRWYDIHFFPELRYTLLVSEEITQRKSAVSKNVALLNFLPDQLYGIHKSGQIVDYKKFPDFPGFGEKEKMDSIGGLTLGCIFPKSRVGEIQTIVNEVLAGDTQKGLEYHIIDDEGEKHFEARFTKVSPLEAITIIRNITDRKKAEALKNEFISLVSHELRTPLTSIRGSIELLLAGVAGELSNQSKSLLNICRKNTQRLIRFVTDLLEIEALDSKNVNFKFKIYPLEEIVQSSVDSMRTFAEQYHVLLNLEKSSNTSLVYVDEDRLNHCITNLISNAVKYTPKYSEVLIQTQKLEKSVLILVKDNGPGIDPNFIPRLFHRFAQGAPPKDKLVGGSGLGLSITKGFVEAMSGSIKFFSNEQGTTFTLEFPLVEETKEQ